MCAQYLVSKQQVSLEDKILKTPEKFRRADAQKRVILYKPGLARVDFIRGKK